VIGSEGKRVTRIAIVNDPTRGPSITIDAKRLDEYLGRDAILGLYNNNQEIAKAMSDTRWLIGKLTDVVDIGFSENPGSKDLKDIYERAVNIAGFFLYRHGDFSGAEDAYKGMLQALYKFESHGSAKLHKGLTFHNIAISQFMERNFDEAVPNFLRAINEDVRAGLPASQSFAGKILNERYVQPLIDKMKNGASPVFQQLQGKALSTEVTDTLNLLPPELMLFLLQVWLSFETNRRPDNLYSQCRAFDNAKNLALITETFLRSCCLSTANSAISNRYRALAKPKLADIMRCLFDSASWFGDVSSNWGWTQFGGGNLPTEVDNKLFDLLNRPLAIQRDQLVRAILLLGLVRNFTAHEFDPGSDLAGKIHEDVVFRMLAVLLALVDDLKQLAII
jgi:hypothetical protein